MTILPMSGMRQAELVGPFRDKVLAHKSRPDEMRARRTPAMAWSNSVSPIRRGHADGYQGHDAADREQEGAGHPGESVHKSPMLRSVPSLRAGVVPFLRHASSRATTSASSGKSVPSTCSRMRRKAWLSEACLDAAAHAAMAARSSPTTHAATAHLATVTSTVNEALSLTAPSRVRNATAAPPLSVNSGGMTDRSCAAAASLSINSWARIALYTSVGSGSSVESWSCVERC